MLKTKKEEKIVYDHILTAVVCNCCGKEVETDCGFNDTDITSINISFGYGSGYDNTDWRMDICDECLDKWVSTFKYKININQNNEFL